jgi:hypothetical protein
MNRSQSSFALTSVGLISLAALSTSASALPPWWNATTQKGYQTNIADYFQHQKWGTAGAADPGAEATWEFLGGSAGGWCYMTSIVNGLFKFKRDGYNVLPAGYDGANWVTTINSTIKSWATNMIVNGRRVDQLLPITLGFKSVRRNGLGRLIYDSWSGERAYPAGTTFFDAASRDFKEDDIVLLRFDSNPPRTADTWWNFHMVTLAGMEMGANPRMYFADPDVNGGNNDALSVFSLSVRPIPGVTAQRFAAAAAVPVPAAGAAGALPANWDRYYNRGSVVNDKLIGDSVPDFRYDGMPITGLRVIEPQCIFLDPPVPAPGLPGRTIERAVCSAGRYGSTDDFFIFPNAPVQAGSVTLDGPVFGTGRWLALSYPASVTNPFIDPWGNVWYDGAIRVMKLSGGSNITGSAAINGVSFTVLGSCTAFDVFYKSADPSDLGTWRVQAFGSNFQEPAVQTQGSSGLNCAADFNQDGGVDGQDVTAFFDAWEGGDSAADVNADGGVDGQDVSVFFAQWQSGGC